MKVYISGNRDEVISEATRHKFRIVADMLRHNGWEPFDPTDEEWQIHLKKVYERDKGTYQPYTDGHMPSFLTYCLLRNMMSLSVKDAICMIDDYVACPVARTELAFAETAGMYVYVAGSQECAQHYLYDRKWRLLSMEAGGGMSFQETWPDICEQYTELHMAGTWLPIKF